jgi:hypothetical protein
MGVRMWRVERARRSRVSRSRVGSGGTKTLRILVICID